MPQKKTFDWMRQQLNGFMRTQIIGAAATLSLADHLQGGPRTVRELASMTGLDKGMTFRLLRALATIGLAASEDEPTFQSLPPFRRSFPRFQVLSANWQRSLQRRRSICREAISSRDSKRDRHKQRRHWDPIYLTITRVTPKRPRSSKRRCK
jgi:hypothetical protein